MGQKQELRDQATAVNELYEENVKLAARVQDLEQHQVKTDKALKDLDKRLVGKMDSTATKIFEKLFKEKKIENGAYESDEKKEQKK